ncbi:MHS family MFS transporter [Metallosphaera tengchongensis]|uniref:MHS family MFS transporter n=1 Tax=Metallosphaera tengchongensis TaxID=1532350 RepID=A0A6N0NVV7_9CREN|nr:MFS transporter [Metallosphaera tengchongensis]QKR00357.1 MHS family MFS transporter [Metallosphaera tengchongensis]
MSDLKLGEKVKVGIFSLVGTTIEYYDFFLYALLSVLVFPKIFFPPGYSQLSAMLISLSTYFVSFLARPVGAMIFGNMGDKQGRRTGLSLNMVLVGASYVLIGSLPGYSALGFDSVLLLVLLRFLFGLGIGGEYGGAIAIVLECNWKSENKGLWSWFVQSGPALGEMFALLGLLVFHRDLTLWWRVLVLLGGIIAIINFFVRKNISESPAFLEVLRLRRMTPLARAIKNYYKQILVSSALVSLGASVTTLIATYALPIMKLDNVSLAVGIQYLMVGDTVVLISLLPLTWLGTTLRRSLVAMSFLVLLGALVSLPGLYFLFSGKDLLLAIVLLKLSTISWAQYGLLNASSFPVEVRYTASGFSYQIGAMYAGGLSPLISSFFVVHGSFLDVYFIVLGYTMVSGIGLVLYRILSVQR